MNLKPILLLLLAFPIAAPATLQEQPSQRPGPNVQSPRDATRRGTPNGRGPRGQTWNEMNEADRKAVTKFVQEHFPRMAVELDGLKESSPKQYERRMDRVASEMRRLMDVTKKDPRRGTALIRERQLGFQLQEMAGSYHSATDTDEKNRIRKDLRELASQELDNRRELRNMEVHQLETKLAELKSRISEMESVREDMLDRRTKELLERKPRRERDNVEEKPGETEPAKPQQNSD